MINLLFFSTLDISLRHELDGLTNVCVWKGFPIEKSVRSRSRLPHQTIYARMGLWHSIEYLPVRTQFATIKEYPLL